MTARNDGGPAFPSKETRNSIGQVIATGYIGMSLRDYLAGQALIGLTGGNWTHDGGLVLSGAAYRIADAMLEAREK